MNYEKPTEPCVLGEKDNIANDSTLKLNIARIRRRRRSNIAVNEMNSSEERLNVREEAALMTQNHARINKLPPSLLPIVVNNDDIFCREQSFCTICDSSGIEEEAVSLRCIQCCQEYHSYCLKHPIRDYSIKDGWRCSDCSICNICKSRNHQKPITFCSTCNMAYHTECTKITKHKSSPWVCEFCIKFNIDQRNSNECNLCHVHFKPNELLIFCPKCHRWSHASCLNVMPEDLIRLDEIFTQCSNCRIVNNETPLPPLRTLPTTHSSIPSTVANLFSENVWRILSDITSNFNVNFDTYVNQIYHLNYLLKAQYYSQTYNYQYPPYDYNQYVKDRTRCDLILLDIIRECNVNLRDCYSNVSTARMLNSNEEYLLCYIIQLYYYFANYLECAQNIIETYKIYNFAKNTHIIFAPVHDNEVANFNNIVTYYNNAADSNLFVDSNTIHPPNIPKTSTGQTILYKIYTVPEETDASNFTPRPHGTDIRTCVLCGDHGDKSVSYGGRLIYISLDTWIHVECAIYSQGIRVKEDGSIHAIGQIILNGSKSSCAYCSNNGATFSCGCNSNLKDKFSHITCALLHGHWINRDKLICPSEPKLPSKSDYSFILRPYFIHCSIEDRLLYFLRNSGHCSLKKGNLIISSIGSIHPLFESKLVVANTLLSFNYKCTKKYWDFKSTQSQYSTSDQLRTYNFSTACHSDGIVFKITCDEDSSSSIDDFKGAWKPITATIKSKMNPDLHLSSGTMNFLKIFGFREFFTKALLESFESVQHFSSYPTPALTFRTLSNFLPIVVNPSGSVRSEPIVSKHTRIVLKIKNNKSSEISKKHERTREDTLPNNGNGNQPRKVDTSKSLRSIQYRFMKKNWITSVRVQKSLIHGYGLFALQDFQPNTTIMEYVGCIIRNEVANVKEKQYEQENRGVYMFRLDPEYIVDATMYGGPARFVNHSCDPNCTAEIITIDKIKKIVIVSIRPIKQNEEITYNYQMDFEDSDKKLECSCGAASCRKWLN